MAIDFPPSPVVGQKHPTPAVAGVPVYTWDGEKWLSTGVEPFPIPPGTVMLFIQAAAPTGWTKITTHNDKALRIVSGTGGGSGGSIAFSTAFARTATDNFTITTTTIPPHAHNIPGAGAVTHGDSGSGAFSIRGGSPSFGQALTTGTDGGGGSAHAHGIDLRVQYVDTIICEKG